MNETYLDFHIAVPHDGQGREILPAALSEFGFEGFLEDDSGIHCYIKKKEWYNSIEEVIKEISAQFYLPFITLLSATEFTNRNWNEEWEKSIQPIRVTDKIIITPSWHPVNEPDKIVLTIDPKMTFGTGYHETTRLMLRLMEQFITPQSLVLDIGTGTGILAIAAVKLGANHAVGIDIDELSLENGIENTERNNVSGKVEIRIGSLEAISEPAFDIVLANIIRNTILELLDGMLAKLSPAGTILFSGLLKNDQAVMEKELRRRGVTIASVIQENEWIAIAARRIQA